MSRILKRPMFRRGGSTNDGIMTGIVDREKKAAGDLGPRTEEILAAMQQYAPLEKTKFPLGQLGLNLASGQFAGDGLLQNIIGSARGPYAQFVKADDARKAAQAKRKASAVATALSEQSALQLAKTKALLRDPKIATEKKVEYVKKIMGFKTDKEALEYINTSLSDVSKATPENRIQKVMGKQLTPNRAKAIFQVALEPNIPLAKKGGFMKTTKFPKDPVAGKLYFSTDNGVLYQFNGGATNDINNYTDVPAEYNKENISF